LGRRKPPPVLERQKPLPVRGLNYDPARRAETSLGRQKPHPVWG